MHALMATILLGRCGLDQVRQNAEADPPDGERGEPAERLGRNGHAGITPETDRKPVLLERARKDDATSLDRGTRERATAEQLAAEPIDDGQWIAETAIAEPELAFEVRGPDRVGRVHRRLRAAGMPGPPHATRRDDEPGALAMQGERAPRGPWSGRLALAQDPQQLAWPPRRMMPTHLEQGPHELGRGPGR